MDFLATGRQNDPGLRRRQPQERGLSHRRSCSKRPGPRSSMSSARAERQQSVAKLAAAGAEILRLRRRARRPDRPPARRARRASARSLHGLVHSIAFADYADGPQPFHETPKAAFLRAVDISCYSLIALSQRVSRPARPRRLGRDDFDLDHAHGQRELRLHGPDQGGARFVAGISGQVVQPLLAGAVQRRRPGLAEDLGLGRHSRLRRFLSVRRASDAAQAGRANRRSRPTSRRFCSARARAASMPRTIVVDAGMSINYFDRDLVRRAMRPE